MNKMNLVDTEYNDHPLSTPDEVAKALKVSLGTVYYWASRNEIPLIRVGRHLRFRIPDIVAHFEEKTRYSKQACQSPVVGLKSKLQRSLKTKDASRADLQKKE